MSISEKMKQVRIDSYGSPEVMKIVEAEVPMPGQGEVLIKVEAIGVNYSDTLRRRNRYFQPTPLPYVLGSEAVGQIVALGEAVAESFAEGATVLAILPLGGGYSEYIAAQAQFCVPLPPNIEADAATAIFVQGSTAQLMVSQVAPDLNGKTVVINAAAGGVGSLLLQLAKLNGAKVIATSSSDDKLKFAESLGADATVNYSRPDWSKQVKAANGGQGVDVVFEMIGGKVYNESIKSLAQGGQIIVYGAASGQQGSVHSEYFVDENISQSGFNLAFFIKNKMPVWQEALGTVISLLAQGKLKVETAKTFALADVAEAHRQIEARQTTGKVVLKPGAFTL